EDSTLPCSIRIRYCSENIVSHSRSQCHLVAKPLEMSKAPAFEALGVTLIKIVSTNLQVGRRSAHNVITDFENRASSCNYRPVVTAAWPDTPVARSQCSRFCVPCGVG